MGALVVKARWLGRRIAAPGPHLALCLTEDEFQAACRHCRIQPPRWVTEGANATCHHIVNPQGKLVCVVAIDGWAGRDPIEVAGLLIHEAVHIWQRHAEDIGERNPGDEQEAYAIQSIAQELLAEFARRIAV